MVCAPIDDSVDVWQCMIIVNPSLGVADGDNSSGLRDTGVVLSSWIQDGALSDSEQMCWMLEIERANDS